jgi:hypothetical protein
LLLPCAVLVLFVGMAEGQEIIPGVAANEGSVRDRARTVVKEDREFLRDLETAEPPPGAPAAGAAPVTPTRPPEPVPESARIRRVPEGAPAPPRAASRREPEPSGGFVPRPANPAPEPVAEAPGGLTPEEIRDFVQHFVRVSEGATPEGELALYAAKVDYFDGGPTSREAIEADQRKYYRRWPSRQFTLVREPQILRLTADSATARYRLRYELNRGKETARGETEHVVRLKLEQDGLKIVGLRERKIGGE